ncbi:DMT family transporter [Amycolatopsis suaedae]|uniref:DMT family transporter n=1 Tax=Amycolatopsis suaedae TaxID=2510978 RepID=A0A4Q7J9V6_9PSEU|nr:DMT family transporter [Amycolatopsis suaedae]RZQ64029.1 DMT family transporter [Amycolatopsis suaedae]
MTEVRTLLRMAALALMWGSSFLWIKLALNAFSPVQLVLGRVALGAAVLIGLVYLRRGRLPGRGPIWGHLTVAALLHCAVPFTLFAIGEQTVDSGITGVINSTTPLWALLTAVLWRMDRDLSATRLTGLLLGIAGTVVIFAPWQASGLVSWGALACLAASASYGVVFVYEERFLSGSGESPVALAGTQMLLASGFLALAMPVGGMTPVHLDIGAIIAVTMLGLFSTGVAFALNYQLLATEGAVAASAVGYLLPVVSVLLGAVFLGENVDLRVIAGMVVVLAGVALTRVKRRSAALEAVAEPARS